MFCNKCGKQLKDGTKFCPRCGNKIEAIFRGGGQVPEVQTPEQPEYVQPEYAEPKNTQPEFAQPVYAEPENGQPEYNQPEYKQPEYEQPDNMRPEHKQPAIDRPENIRPEFKRPEDKRPGNKRPGYKPPRYVRPVYEEEEYDDEGSSGSRGFLIPLLVILGVLIVAGACVFGLLFFYGKVPFLNNGNDTGAPRSESVDEQEDGDDAGDIPAIPVENNTEETPSSAVIEEAEEAKADEPEDETTSTEKMYQKVSDLFGHFVVTQVDDSESFHEYEGYRGDLLYTSGDWSRSYADIVSFEDNTLVIDAGEGETIKYKYIAPWIIEGYLADGSAYWIMDGDISMINEAMADPDVPQYIFPDSDKISSEKTVMNYQISRYARNEIYARHGRRFSDEKLQAFFDARSWYNGTIEPDDFKDDVLNKIEKQNASEMKEWEELLQECGLGEDD